MTQDRWKPKPEGKEATAKVEGAVRSDREVEVCYRILIVDEEDLIRAAIRRVLHVHEVVGAASGVKAMQILEQDRDYDLILCDVMMSQVSGVDIHQWLAANDPTLAERVVFISGGGFTPRIIEYLKKVGNIWLEKPFDMKKLIRIIRKRIKSSQGG